MVYGRHSSVICQKGDFEWNILHRTKSDVWKAENVPNN